MWSLLILRYRRLNNEQKKRFKWGGQLKYSGNRTIITRLLKRLLFLDVPSGRGIRSIIFNKSHLMISKL